MCFQESTHDVNPEKSFKPYQGDLPGAPDATCPIHVGGLDIEKINENQKIVLSLRF